MLLNLPGWTVDRTEETRQDLLIAVTPASPDFLAHRLGG